MLPDWIPNIHPLIVHFPIALLVTAVLFDLIRLRFNQLNWLQNTVIALYSIGSIGLIAAFFSGRQAVETVTVLGEAVPVVTSHEDWALYTLIFFGLFTALRLYTWWKDLEKGWVFPALIIPALIGTGMLWYTGEQGAKLVYKHGVAVGEIDRLNEQIESLEQRLAEFREDAAPDIREDGSWTWRISAGADQALTESFSIEGADNFQASTEREDGRTHLEITGPEEELFMITGGDLSVIDGRAEINLEDFDGEFMLIHHYTDTENYQYIRITGSELQQGQMLNGSDNILGTGQIEEERWSTFRVTASGPHYYGYQDQQTILHTHNDELEPGQTGIALKGSGTVKIRLIEFSTN
ncbi:DUF2231 domain-containing protein [Rhodohalobacter halophilus]|uniref:DUF2231 domain-containing protein n=1 Tax=Rhodohalobacter halophilus TaxID=1812810 RepID=UPI00083FAFBD|nr:DUF2231 domain-containing protein [Rhodohalobacter halophilus]